MQPVRIWLFLLWMTSSGLLHGFSPYELYLASGLERQVMLGAALKDGADAAIAELFPRLSDPSSQKALSEEGIREVVLFRRELFGQEALFVRFLYSGENPYLEAAERFERATGGLEMASYLEPIIPEKKGGQVWHQLEWINHIRGDRREGGPTQRVGIICEIRPEKETDYRLLHQSVWPGVVDQVVRGNIRDLGIFLLPIHGHLVEILYLDYMGTDGPADDAANKADLANQRWWRHTDACQQPLPGVEGGIWDGLDCLYSPTEAVPDSP